MKEIVQHSIYGEIVYNESFWTGKKALTINGVDAKPISKKEYMVNEKRAILKGSFLTGSTLLIEGETIQLSPKAKWYEIILAIIPFLFLLTWGNSASLCSIFPVVGGAIGGALGGVGAVISLFLMKTQIRYLRQRTNKAWEVMMLYQNTIWQKHKVDTKCLIYLKA